MGEVAPSHAFLFLFGSFNASTVDLTHSCKPLVLPFIFAVLFLLINMSFTFHVTSAGREAIRPLSAEFGHVTQATQT